jgi:hypothetical protein
MKLAIKIIIQHGTRNKSSRFDGAHMGEKASLWEGMGLMQTARGVCHVATHSSQAKTFVICDAQMYLVWAESKQNFVSLLQRNINESNLERWIPNICN